MNRWIRSLLALSLGLSLLLCSGCSSLFPYESAEEQKEQENNQNGIGLTPSGGDKTAIDLESLRSDDLVYTNTLRNSAGSVLATYTGSVPTFRSPSGYALAFQRINEHFQVQYAAFQEDCEAYFNRVKQYYGDDWDTVAVTTTVFHTNVTYQMLQAPDHYLSLDFTYVTCIDGINQKTYQLGEVLLLDTGWVLQAAELFGSHYEEAQTRILDGVAQWARARGILAEGSTVTFTAQQLLKNFALTESKLVLYLDPYTLSANDSASYVVYLSLSDYADLITDIEIPEDDDADPEDTTVTPDNDLLPQLPGTTPGAGAGATGGDGVTDGSTDGDAAADAEE